MVWYLAFFALNQIKTYDEKTTMGNLFIINK